MSAMPLKLFVHPHKIYQLEYPAHWDQVIEKDGASCGFGPHERDDVGLWISVMAMRIDSEKLNEELPNLMRQALDKFEATNCRRDPTLHHHGLVADVAREGEGGHYWILTGGGVVLFASSQVPAGERDVWNPPFQQLMASLLILRDDQLLVEVAGEVLSRLRKRYPEQEFEFDGDTIRGRGQVVYLSNLVREIQATPAGRDRHIEHFVTSMSLPENAQLGQETWQDARKAILPVLKPRNYVEREGPTRHMLTSDWLSDLVICYAIKSKKLFRFVTAWDVNRWGTTNEALHEQAVANLAALPWPRELQGARLKNEGRVIIVDTADSLASSRLLHPELHKLFSSALGSPFYAGIPCRNTLVLFSDRKALKARIGRRLRQDHKASPYPITPQPFLVTPDGIAAPA